MAIAKLIRPMAKHLFAGPTILLLLAAPPRIFCGRLQRLNAEGNPLLTRLGDPFPPFDAIEARHVVPAVDALLQEFTDERIALETATKQPGYRPDAATLLKPYRLMGERLSIAWRLVQHLSSVRDSEELRHAIDVARPRVINTSQLVSHSQPLFQAFRTLGKDEAALSCLTAPQQRVVKLALQGFEHSGIGLTGQAKDEFDSITQRLSALSNDFSENVLDSTKAWKRFATADDLRGVPDGPLHLAAMAAKRERDAGTAVSLEGVDGSRNASATIGSANLRGRSQVEQGDYLLTLDAPSISPVLMYAQNPELRKELLLASISRASDLNGPDNAPVLREILEKRQRQARLLGFSNFVDLAFSDRMATRSKADKLLDDLHKVARPRAVEDLAELRQFASEEMKSSVELHRWDMSFFQNKQAKKKFDIDPEELRPYFPLERCLAGLFDLTEKMFDVTWAKAEAPTWHKDVKVYQVRRVGSGSNRTDLNSYASAGHLAERSTSGAQSPVADGHIFLDLFARSGEKKAGAWQMSLADYDAERGLRPIAVVAASFRPPAEGQPALLSYGELHTLFHEFGHALQSLLTTQQEPTLAGLQGVEWDAVELASQFMEYFLDESPWLVPSIARHHETGQPLDPQKLEMVKRATKSNAGLGMLGQLQLSLVDLDLHSVPLGPDEAPQDRYFKVATERQTTLLPRLAQDRFLNAFSHIFAGGYAAGYYSYLFANVLAADAFAKFEEADALGQDEESLRRLRQVGGQFAATVLGEGGGREAAEVFRAFRGREPSTAALLRYSFPHVAGSSGAGGSSSSG